MFFKKHIVYAPISGTVRKLETVNDPVFANKMMGDGIAIDYQGGSVLAPFDGVVSAIIPTHHAIGVTDKNGIELIIHIGLDTVKLKESPFTCVVTLNEAIKKGQQLIQIDSDLLKASGCDLASPLVISNTNGRFVQTHVHEDEHVESGTSVLFKY